jgi:hypothetical protein
MKIILFIVLRKVALNGDYKDIWIKITIHKYNLTDNIRAFVFKLEQKSKRKDSLRNDFKLYRCILIVTTQM